MILKWAREVHSCNPPLRIASWPKQRVRFKAMLYIVWSYFFLEFQWLMKFKQKNVCWHLQRMVMRAWGLVGFLVDFCFTFFFFLVFLCLLDNCIFYCVFLRCFENKLIILSPFDLKPSEFCSCMYSDLSESNSAVHFSYCLCLCMPELFLHFFSWVEIWWVSVVPIWIMKLSYSKAFCHTAIPLLGSEHQLTLWLIRHVDYCWCSLCKSFIGIFNKAS